MKENIMYRQAFELIVRVNGQPVKEYVHDNVTYVEGKRNSRYTLKLKNNTPKRALAIVSVDGIDVLKGKPAEQTESGYIIDGNSSLEIKGYRIDNDKVAEFIFDDGKNSYSSYKTKNEKNNGVIGVRFFAEVEKPYVPYVPPVEHHHHHHYPKPAPVYPYPTTPWYPYNPPYWYTCGGTSAGLSGGNNTLGINSSFTTDGQGLTKSASSRRLSSGTSGKLSSTDSLLNFQDTNQAMFCASAAQAPSVPKADLGTTWGDQIQDRVRTVEFEKGALITQIEIYYASRKSLEKIGVNFDERKTVYQPTRPKAFGDSEYCEPPTGWKAK